MKDLRVGECLWSEWIKESDDDSAIVFYTVEHVDVEHEVVKRALASALQREGTVTTLGDGFKAIEKATIETGYAGYVDSDIYLEICDEFGETPDGDEVDEILPVTWVSLNAI
jgi:hypothetical protein